MTRPRPCVLAPVLLIGLLGLARPASADITGFLGFSPTTDYRGARGVAVGFSLLVVGFEFEYSDVSQDAPTAAPGLRSGMFNLLLQTPIPIARMQFYFTGGGGVYREELGALSQTDVAANLGGGVKVGLIGPLRARFDYRVFKLHGTPINDRYQRLYAGININF